MWSCTKSMVVASSFVEDTRESVRGVLAVPEIPNAVLTESPNDFINACICVETGLLPHQLLLTTQNIEKELGRIGKSVNQEYHDRVIDIDILLYDDLSIDEPDLKIPHPLMNERDFVMKPLQEILK